MQYVAEIHIIARFFMKNADNGDIMYRVKKKTHRIGATEGGVWGRGESWAGFVWIANFVKKC